jgi:LPS O-antigen subunit length determinant protein (WzzB/FepE family)
MTTIVDTETSEDEISIVDIYDFFATNLVTIVIWVVVAIGVGAVVAFSLPVKFEASAVIEPAKVANSIFNPENKTLVFTSSPVESKEILAEKLKLPTYFNDKTVMSCGLENETNPQAKLAKDLNSSIARNSNFVAISFKANSPQLAKDCLEGTLLNIVSNQDLIATSLKDKLEIGMRTVNAQLESAKAEQKQLPIFNREKLTNAKAKLEADQKFVEQFSKDALTFKFDNPQFSASALLLNTLVTKQNDIKQQVLEINRLQFEVDTNITSKDSEVLQLSQQLQDYQNALTPPLTKPASFATPIYAPDQKVEPKRSIIMLVSVFAGFALSVMFLLGRKALRHVQAQRLA